MLSFSQTFDEIMQSLLDEHRFRTIESQPRYVRILIHAPQVLGFTLLPPVICDVILVNHDDVVYAAVVRWFTWEVPYNELDDVFSQLLTFEEFLQEYQNNENDETEENEDEQ